ncbi:disease resistance protein Pik-2-like [Triticum dicoccoides]|uniref:disease resistance protein Pik-2-like n=1 Tax=Triticum dicoccoides TaxID=85692 RepID=UPI0018911F98|nr:disease resistance protein Pik-2-like [Triticum dicoccoides]
MESAAKSIASKVGQVLVDELQDIRGVGNKVVHLRDELATMNAALRIISEADQDKVDHLVREWEKQVHDLAYDAEDCTDTYSLRIIRPSPPPPDDFAGNKLIFSWAGYLLGRAKRVARYPYEKLVLQRTLAADIKDLLARTTTISERRVRYGIDRAELPRAASFIPVSASSISASALRRAHNPDQFVGITDQVSALAVKIKAADQDEDDKSLKVFSIVGFGGLGKTTLAMEVCRQLDKEFPRQAMVSVPQAFAGEKDVKGLLVRVLQQILKEKQPNGNQLHVDRMDVDDLSKKIKELLKQTRCLIVVDDVWSLSSWEAIRGRLAENNCGSRIILTTRIDEVAKAASVSEYFVHHMKTLELEASQKLFVQRVFGSTDCPSELKVFMDTILKRCGGLPLAIVSIASLFGSYRSAEGIEMWERVSRSIGSQLENHPNLEGMRRLLALSYDYLPHHLKACMLYLSIFPEDYVIAKDRLLYRWIAEGLVTEKRGLTLLEVAEEYFNELISRNMIQLDKCLHMDFGLGEVEVEGLRVHDMILEVMVSKSQEYGLGKLLDSLGEFKLLRVLDLNDCRALQNKHMRDVCRLYLLRFLSLRGTHISVMPHKVGNLEHLEILDIKNTGIGVGLPRTVAKLSKLECLRCSTWLLPRGLGNMKSLRILDTGILDGDNVQLVTQEIGKMAQLQEIRIIIESNFQTGEFIQESLPMLSTSLSKTSILRSLHLECNPSPTESAINFEFLHGVNPPPPVLQRLSLIGRIIQLPAWISLLTHLTKFEVGWSQLAGDQLFGVLCKLPNLQTIQLGGYSYVGPKLVAHEDHSFPVLKILKVSLCPTMIIFEEGLIKKLETLALVVDDMNMNVLGLENLENLKEVKIRDKDDNQAMKHAVVQLKTLSESKPIKVVHCTILNPKPPPRLYAPPPPLRFRSISPVPYHPASPAPLRSIAPAPRASVSVTPSHRRASLQPLRVVPTQRHAPPRSSTPAIATPRRSNPASRAASRQPSPRRIAPATPRRFLFYQRRSCVAALRNPNLSHEFLLLHRLHPFAGPDVTLVRDLNIHERVPVKLDQSTASYSAWKQYFSLVFREYLLHGHVDGTVDSALMIHDEDELYECQQLDSSIDDFCMRLKKLADELCDLEETVGDELLISTLTAGLNEDFENAASNLTLIPEPTFAKVVAYLKLEERRMRMARTRATHAALVTGTRGGQAPPPPRPTPPQPAAHAFRPASRPPWLFPSRRPSRRPMGGGVVAAAVSRGARALREEHLTHHSRPTSRPHAAGTPCRLIAAGHRRPLGDSVRWTAPPGSRTASGLWRSSRRGTSCASRPHASACPLGLLGQPRCLGWPPFTRRPQLGRHGLGGRRLGRHFGRLGHRLAGPVAGPFPSPVVGRLAGPVAGPSLAASPTALPPASPAAPVLPSGPVTRARTGVHRPSLRYSSDEYLLAASTTEPSPLPASARTALCDPHWLAAMQEEFDALQRNSTWTLVPRPPRANVITGKSVFRHKTRSDGTLERYKARWVVSGF